MPSPQLAQCLAESMAFAERSGALEGVFDVPRYRAALEEAPFPLPDGTTIHEVQLERLKCYVVAAPGATSLRRMVYIHGGGLVVGGFHSHKGIAAWIALFSGCTVVFPEYRLAPEHAYPAALDDVMFALEWTCGNDLDGANASDRIFIAGDSAGAGLAAAALIRANADIVAKIRAAVFICPMLNWDEQRSPALRKSQFRRTMASAYVGRADPANPLVSPEFGSWSCFPRLLIQAANGDEFFPDARAAMDIALKAGKAVNFEAWPDMPHVWHRFVPFLPEAKTALERAGAFICSEPAGA